MSNNPKVVCIMPPALTEEQIDSILDQAAEANILYHAEHCPHCQAQLGKAKQVDALVSQHLFRWDCPTSQQLGDFQVGMLDQAAQIRIAQHLRLCVYCQKEIGELQAFLDIPRPTSTTPKMLTKVVKRINELIGELTTPVLAPVLRGTDIGPLMFKAADITIFLQLQITQKRYTLVGQILDDQQDRWRGALVKVYQFNAMESVGIVDDTMNFQCNLSQTGVSDVRIIAETGVAIVLPNVLLEQ
jgi:hypothetical protein